MAVPTDVAGLKGWFDFSDASTLFQDSLASVPVTADGQRIQYADNKAGGGGGVQDLSQVVTAKAPFHKTGASGINGRSVAQFDGTDDFLSASVTADSSWTVFIVARKRTAPTTTRRTLFGANTLAEVITDTDLGNAYVWADDQNGAVVGVAGTPTNVNAVVVHVTSASAMSVRLNGSAAAAFNPHDQVTTGTVYSFGADTAGANFGDFDIGEIVAYDSALTPIDLDAIGSYLATKWGFTWNSVATSTLAQVCKTFDSYFPMNPHRVIDYTQNGVWWAAMRKANGTYGGLNFYYSTNGGATWALGATMGDVSSLPAQDVAMFIDKDDYMHVVYSAGGGSLGPRLRYRRGTPNAARTSYTWSADFIPHYQADGEMTDMNTGYDVGLDIIAFKDGTGYQVFLTYNAFYGGDMYCQLNRVSVSSGGTFTYQQVFSGIGAGGSVQAFNALDFRHDANDPKAVQASTPSVYWAFAHRDSGHFVNYKKISYSAGAWTESSNYNVNSSNWSEPYTPPSLYYDGTRIVIGWTPRNLNQPWVTEATEAGPIFTNINPPALSEGLVYNQSLGYDASGNIWLVASGDTSRDLKKCKYDRATGTWGAWSPVFVGNLGYRSASTARRQGPAAAGGVFPVVFQDQESDAVLVDLLVAATGFAGTIASTLPKLRQSVTVVRAGGTVTSYSAPVSATTQAAAANTGTVTSVLSAISTQATAVRGATAGTAASTLPKLVQSVTAVHASGTLVIVGSTLPKLTQAAQALVVALPTSDWSASASATTQAASVITATVASVLPKVSTAAQTNTGTATDWSSPASATTQGGVISGTVALTLPKLITSVAVSHTAPGAVTIASVLPKLVQAVQAAVGTTEYTAWASVQITVTSSPAGSIASTLPKLTQAATALAFTTPVGSITSVLGPVTQTAAATHGPVFPVQGTIASTLPKLVQAVQASTGVPVPAVGPIIQVLPAIQQDATVLVDTILPPPPTPVGAQGLVHIFQKATDTRLLPATNSPLQVVGGFQDRASMVGGYQSATGTISEEEFNAHPEVYTVGATWRVKSVDLEEAGLNPFIFAGELKEPQIAGGVVTLAADGWGLLQDRSVERFLVASMAMDQWAPGDEDPFNFSGVARILAEVRGKRMVFETKPHTSFKRNDAGQPGVWRSVPLVFWAPKVDLRWIKFTIKATGRNMNPYDLELVGTPTGPSGNLTVLRTWNLNNQNTDATFAFQIPAGYDLVGLRMIRSTEAKRPPHVRVAITDMLIGSIATKEPFTLTEAYTALFGKMGVSSQAVTSDPQDVLPYDAARVPLSDIADDLAVFGQWYWRIWANAAGSKQGEAGPIGATTWQVQLVHTPVRVLPQPRYNVVQFDYQYGGGYTSQDKVRANPDPYPGTDVVYVLNIPEPPVFPLAQRLAQQIANMVSKPWYSGSGTLFKVNPGDRPAAVVKPGDKLVLQNYGSVEVIVNELSHSEDGALVEASFAESSMIVDRWLALWQQKINQGLSPNGAALAFLDAADPKPPTISAGFSVSQKREGRIDYDLQANATTVNEDIEDNGTYVSRYGFRARPIWPPGHANAGQPVPRAQGGGWRERTVRAPRDDEVEETKEATWDKILHPKKWAWEVQGWAVDALGQKSSRVTVFPGKPAAFIPVAPQSVSLDVDQRVMTVRHVIPPDPDEVGEEDQSYHHADIRINDQNGNWNNPLVQDRKVKGEHKRFRFHKPLQGTYYAQVTYVDFWGNRSTPVWASNAKKIPPVPLIGAPQFDVNGSRHARYRLRVPVTVNDAGHDDEVKRIIVQLVHKPNNVAPDANDRKARDQVRINDDPQEALFRNLPKTQFVFVRAMSVDSDQKESGWTGWIPMGRPKDSGMNTIPPQPSWTGLPAGQVKVTTPTPRRVVADWDEPDDDEATRWRVVFKRGATTVDTMRTRNTRAVYRVPKADVSQVHTAEVYAINDTGGESSAASGSGTPDPDEGGGVATNPPNVPSNPSFTADGQGTRHSKYRIIVTAGTSTVDANHDAPHRYVLQLVHSFTDTGANPPAGAKRQTASVEGDGVGEELQEVFRNIPKKHHVWVRQRARNAAGASNWTGWRTSSRPIDFGVAVAPAPPTGVNVTTPVPRRVKVTWDDPDLTIPGGEEDVTRWRVQIFRAGNLIETGYTRTTRYIYHVPANHVGQNHNARVYAVSDTGTDSSQLSNDGSPSGDPSGALVGSIRWHAGPGVPNGYLHCDGTPLNSGTYPALYGAIGQSHSPPGTALPTFHLPDIKNRKVKAKGNLGNIGDNEGNAEGGRDDKHQHKNHHHDNHKHDNHKHKLHKHGNHGHIGDPLDDHVGANADEAGGHGHGAGSLQTNSVFSYQYQTMAAQGSRSGGDHTHGIGGSAGAKDSAHFHDSQGTGRYIEGRTGYAGNRGYHKPHGPNPEQVSDEKDGDNEGQNDPKGNNNQFNDDEKRSPHIVLWAIIRTDDI